MLALRGIHKKFGGHAALTDVSFEMKAGEIVALLGPSGSGKSTLLSIVAGLEVPDNGQVLWDGQDITNVPSHRRGFGLMFQDYALFPHRDVFGNVAFGLEMMGKDREKIRDRVKEGLELVGLSLYERREVTSLSGGEQQRVALARALAPEPRLLMLDEPLGSLDRALRTRLLEDLADILQRSGQTSLYVTHDQEEAYVVADRIVLLNAGRVAQIGTPEELYRQPASAFVARFLGLENIFPASIDGATLHTPIGDFQSPSTQLAGSVLVLLRPDLVELGDKGPTQITGRLLGKEFRGGTIQAAVQAGELKFKLEFPSNTKLPKAGDPVEISFDPQQAIQIFPKDE